MGRKQENSKLCRECGDKRALFVFRGRAKRDNHHDLCPRCFRASMNRFRLLPMAAQIA